MNDGQSVVVTGISTGIGHAVAQVFSRRGWRVFGSVRKPEDGERLRRELGVTALVFDVTDEQGIHAAAEEVRRSLGNARLGGVVNNAGVAGAAPLILQPAGDFMKQLEINLLGPFLVTQAFAPLLGTERSRTGPPGRIVNISSVGGKFGLPFLGAYAASKHGLEGMSESLRRELMLYGIDVIIVAPGSVATPIWDKAETGDLGAYGTSDYANAMRAFGNFMIAEGRKGLPPDAVADVVFQALTAPKPKTRYPVVKGKFKNWILPRLLPSRMVDRAIGKGTGLVPK
ncbi:MAG TPA: SDR family oxidoreductase [Candidatus Acidoferrales bacterium]|nr:SDR family oxidoreductase [Candidatus Acidoferrales bacterium]